MSWGGFRVRGGGSWRPIGRLGVFMVNQKHEEKDELNCEHNTSTSGTYEQKKVSG